jgi:Spy/CpxP family protein refolding chaperone
MLVLLSSLFASTASAGPVDDLQDHVRDHVHTHVQQALDHVGATADQRQAVWDQLQLAHQALTGLHDEARDLRERVHSVLLGPTIDRSALEEARLDAVDLFDRFTTESFALAADLSEVFSVEQRAALHELRHQRIADRLARWRE